MLKSKLQSTLIGMSVTTATLNVAGFLLLPRTSPIEAGYLTPVLVAFGFLQSMILMTNHLHKKTLEFRTVPATFADVILPFDLTKFAEIQYNMSHGGTMVKGSSARL